MAGSDVQSRYLAADTTAADADGVCETQTPAAGDAQDLTIDGALATGGVASFTAARQITVTSAADDSARTFTVVGTDADGLAQTEVIAGPNTATVTGSKFFKTVTKVTVDDDTAGAITVGMGANALSSIFGGRMRLRGIYIVNGAAAGSIAIRNGGPSGEILLQLGTVADDKVTSDVEMRGEGILFSQGGYVAYSVTAPGFTSATAFWS